MAWTSADLSAIEIAIAQGMRTVRLDDREVEYQSISQMLKARDAMKTFLADTDGTRVQPRKHFRFCTDGKGL